MKKWKCPDCGNIQEAESIICEDCDPRDTNDEFDNGPTGHGDECFSDADPGL